MKEQTKWPTNTCYPLALRVRMKVRIGGFKNCSKSGKSVQNTKLKTLFFIFYFPGALVSSSIVFQAGDTALLPCDISVPLSSSSAGGDGLTLVMWYREDVGSPIYSIGKY
jgi:hypothetical protein